MIRSKNGCSRCGRHIAGLKIAVSLAAFLTACAAGPPATQPAPPPAAVAPELPGAAALSIPAASYNIADFGAVGDGKTMNTPPIQDAIDAAAAHGGGHVIIPAGTFLTGPFHLRSNIDLHLNEGAVLLFSRNFDDYPLVYGNFLGVDTVQCQSPITADNLHDVSITGKGAIDGQGDAWRPLKRSKVSEEQWSKWTQGGGVVDDSGEVWYPTRQSMEAQKPLAALRESDKTPDFADYLALRDALRPDMVAIIRCHNALLDGPTFRNTAFWTVQLLWSDHVTVRNVLITNEIWAQNGDGIGIDSCHDVLMENSTVNAGDDNIVLKSGRGAAARKRHLPTYNVLVRNCTNGWGHGGLVIGSETSGDIHDVRFTHCICKGTDIGLRFKSVRGRGGVVENIHVDNITMSDIQGPAILFDMYYEQLHVTHGSYEQSPPKAEALNEGTPCFRNFDIRNVTCNGATQAILMRGLPELPLSDITLQDINIKADTGVSLSNAHNVTLKNVLIEAAEGPSLWTRNVTGLVQEHFAGQVKHYALPSTRP